MTRQQLKTKKNRIRVVKLQRKASRVKIQHIIHLKKKQLRIRKQVQKASIHSKQKGKSKKRKTNTKKKTNTKRKHTQQTKGKKKKGKHSKGYKEAPASTKAAKPETPKHIVYSGTLTVEKLAEKLNKDVSEIIKKLLFLGI